MRLEHFDFALPEHLVAQHPVEPREAARLLHVDWRLADRRIADLPGLVDDRDLLVFNDTKVIPARLFGRRGSAGIELLLHEALGGDRWRAFARPARKLKAGDVVNVGERFDVRVLDNLGGGEVEVALLATDVDDALERHGVMPLPPYIKRTKAGDPADRQDYQTVFAAKPGAVAAPTASLHMTSDLLARLRARGASEVRVTLHVGAGTFLPVKVEDTDDHRMHAERFEVTKDAADAMNRHRARGGRIFAFGTTALRTLQSVYEGDAGYLPRSGRTTLFVQPGVPVPAIDRLLTNFHLPRSTLFMLVAAVSGLGRMRRVYAHAVRAGYRFFSYGDACLLERRAR